MKQIFHGILVYFGQCYRRGKKKFWFSQYICVQSKCQILIFFIFPISNRKSLLIGNTFVYFKFEGKAHIDADTRQMVFLVLIGLAIVGVAFIGMLRRVHPTLSENRRDAELEYKSDAENSIIGAFKNALSLFLTRKMLLLSITFLYTGMSPSLPYNNKNKHFKPNFH